MPAGNPFAPVFDTGGQVSAGPVSGSAGLSLGVSDNHVAAAWVSIALLLLILLWKSKFRFSTTVG